MPAELPIFAALLVASGVLTWVLTITPPAPRWLSRFALYNSFALAAIVSGLLIRWWSL